MGGIFMYVKNYMTANPYTINPEASVADAFELMKDKKIKRVPVLKNGKLVGIVTERKLLEVSPSPATTLSIYEINYLLSKTKIESIMSKDIVAVEPDSLLEEAAVKLRDYDVGGLPVMENGKLVGIITETDLFDAFISILGFRDHGSRISILIEDDKPGVLERITSIIAGYDVNITHIVVSEGELVIRINTLNVEGIIEHIEREGFKVISITRNQ